jgi:hypothetical protein
MMTPEQRTIVRNKLMTECKAMCGEMGGDIEDGIAIFALLFMVCIASQHIQAGSSREEAKEFAGEILGQHFDGAFHAALVAFAREGGST